MIKAVDQYGQPVLIDTVQRSTPCYCPICGQALLQKRGEIREHHFSHIGPRGRNEKGYVPCRDEWNYDKTDWHIIWQKRFPPECYEKVLSRGGQKHIADILINDFVIEFQHSAITIDEFRDRNSFYASCGYSVIWVFDLIEEFHCGKISDMGGGKYHWSYAKKLFREMNLHSEETTIYFQLSDDADSDDESYVMERVTNAYQRFSTFFTNHNRALSIAEFVRYACEDPRKLLYAGEYVESPKAPTNADGFTVYELWNPEYAWMVIKRTTDGKEMFIRGNGGRMFRENYNPHGRIVGKYTHPKYGGGYWYSNDFYVIWDAEKPVWVLKASCKQKDQLPSSQSAKSAPL